MNDSGCQWKELINPETHKKYYYNAFKNQISHEKPKEYEVYLATLRIKQRLQEKSKESKEDKQPESFEIQKNVFESKVIS